MHTETVIGELVRRILDNRLLENMQLVNHQKNKVIKKIIKLIGFYNIFETVEEINAELLRNSFNQVIFLLIHILLLLVFSS
jgi:hypothetical protein